MWLDLTHGLVFQLAVRLVGSASEAEDIVQETYIRAWRQLPSLRSHGASMGWVCRITRNVAIDRRRQLLREKTDSLDTPQENGRGLAERLPSPEAGPEEDAMRAQMGRRLMRMVNKLKEPYRVVLLLRDVDGLSYAEIAEALGISMGTAESRVHRARLMLAQKARGLKNEVRRP
ncbi:MAG: sigma-70 family RNA polymerase sigma factor [Myxococcota bacterium]